MSGDPAPRVMGAAVVRAVVLRPDLWVTAVRQVFRLAPRRWWRRRPFLPVPSREYVEFRMVTQYGGGHGEPLAPAAAADVVHYLEWCREWNGSRS